MSEIPQKKCDLQDIILDKYIKRGPIDEPIEFDYGNDHNNIPPANQCSTEDSEFCTDKVKDEIKLEDDEMDGIRYESIYVAENDVLTPTTQSTTNGVMSQNNKNSTNAPKIVHNTDTPLKSGSTEDSEFSTDKVKDEIKDEIKLEDDEMDGIRYESICVAENDELTPTTPSTTNGIMSQNKENSTNAPKIVHNTNTPFKSCSTEGSEFCIDKVKDEIKLEDDEMDGIRSESICVAENDELTPMTPSTTNGVMSQNKKNSTNAPKIVHNTDTPFKSCSTEDSEFCTDKVKDEIKLEDDEMDGIRYESIYVAENDVLTPTTQSTTNGVMSQNNKNSTNAPKIVHNTDTPLKSGSTEDSEFSTDKVKDEIKDEIKLEDDEMDGIRYESICVAENDELTPTTPSTTNGIMSQNKENSTNAPKIVHNTNTPFKSCSTEGSEFCIDKVKDEIKLEDDEMDGIRSESICVAENDELTPMTPSTTNGVMSQNKKNSTNAPKIVHNTDTPFKSCSTEDSEFCIDKIKDEIKLEDDEMDGIRYESIYVAENDVLTPMTPSTTNGVMSQNKKNSTNAPKIVQNTDTPFEFCSTEDSEFCIDKVKDEIKLEDDDMDGIRYGSICVAENDELTPTTPSTTNGIMSQNKRNSTNAPKKVQNTDTLLKSCSTEDSEFSTDKVKDEIKDEIKLEDDEMDGIRSESICVAENDELTPMTPSTTNGVMSQNKKNSTNAPKIVHNTDTPFKSCSTEDSEFCIDKIKDEIKLEDDEMDGIRYESIYVAENDVLTPMTPSTTNGVMSQNKKNSTNAPKIVQNTDTPFEFCSTEDSEFCIDKVKDEIKLEDDEMDGIRYESIYVAENDVLTPMTPSTTNGVMSQNKKNSTNAPKIVQNTDTPFKFCSTEDSEFCTDKVKDEIKLEVDEIEGIRYESICVAEDYVVSPLTPSTTNGIMSLNKKNSTNAPKIVQNTDTLLKSCSTKESELCTDKGKDEIKLEVDEMDGIRYESICVAENYVLSLMTPSMTNGIKSHKKKNSTNALKIIQNTDTPLKSRSSKHSKLSTNKGKDEIKLKVDEMDGIRHESICVTENVVPSPITKKNSTKSHNKKNSTKAPKIIHDTNRPFKCDTCKKTFTRKEHLKTHKLIHSGKRPYKCETCDKTFSRKDNFKSHQMIHTGEKPFKCGVCNKSFLHKGHIRTHIRIHTGERPYKCNVCGKLFLQEGHLKTHKKIHSGERPYKCNRCNKSYSRKDNLKSHKKIHLGEKPFKCDICKKDFLQKGHVRIHIRTHTGEKPFKCDYCNKTFSRKDNMKDHIGRLHTK